jgi:hypothetical protein
MTNSTAKRRARPNQESQFPRNVASKIQTKLIALDALLALAFTDWRAKRWKRLQRRLTELNENAIAALARLSKRGALLHPEYLLDLAVKTLRHVDIPETSRQKRQLLARIEIASDVLCELADIVGPSRPAFVFDPAEFKISSHLVALALIAQKSKPLNDIPDEYGSGIYALFYHGSLPFYRRIKGDSYPIYVGSATPNVHDAKSPKEQGDSLCARLGEHRKSIGAVERYRFGNLSVSDFSFRYLCVRSGWELAAEHYLIRNFKPVWNKEVKICQGFGKHGDEFTTRSNTRSAWDTVHPGRKWALGKSHRRNKKTLRTIQQEIIDHFIQAPPKPITVKEILR